MGKGQFSEVYKARLHIDNSIVALKKVQVTHYDLTKQSAFMKNFESLVRTNTKSMVSKS